MTCNIYVDKAIQGKLIMQKVIRWQKIIAVFIVSLFLAPNLEQVLEK